MRAAPRAASAWASESRLAGASVSRGAVGLQAADFKRALASRPRARSEHFVLHHCAPARKLSTVDVTGTTLCVDEQRFGVVVPKRHARRAVTRNLIKRQGRAGWRRHAAVLSGGDWLLRLRGPFDVARYPSAASAALRASVRAELDVLFMLAGRPAGG